MLTVADTGIGVARAAIRRACSSRSSRRMTVRGPQSQSGGTGLGLAASARRLVAAMGGRIRLDSEAGAGTHVQDHPAVAHGVRAERARAPCVAPLRCRPPEPLHVLVVDDHAPNRLLLTWQLNILGHRRRHRR
ncbi:ATP-binding protein [Cupriavidus basilensis]